MENTPLVIGELNVAELKGLIVYLARKLPETDLPKLIERLTNCKETKK